MKEVTGIILAGGKSSRMGQDKGLLEVNGKPMVQHIIEKLEAVTTSIIIISNNPEYVKFHKSIYADLIEDQGPVGGIYSGLYYTESEVNIVVSCDVPFISVDLLQTLLENSNKYLVTIPSFKGKEHPLIGIYHKKSLEKFKSSTLENKLKLINVINELPNNIVIVEGNENDNIFLNLNSQEDINKITNGN